MNNSEKRPPRWAEKLIYGLGNKSDRYSLEDIMGQITVLAHFRQALFSNGFNTEEDN